MSGDRTKSYELNQEKFHADDNLKILCLGPNAVGKHTCDPIKLQFCQEVLRASVLCLSS
uniref:Uncharacterized protein n=1 Tax=Urocitellus parryii TaxID=9999 RepID=A0A8D2KHG9_UROPR